MNFCKGVIFQVSILELGHPCSLKLFLKELQKSSTSCEGGELISI